MKLTEVAPHVFQLAVPTSSVFLLLDERITIVDTGPRWQRGRIRRAISELGRDPSEVDRIVLTHAHFDHVGSLSAFANDGHHRHAHRIAGEVIRGERPAQTVGWRPLAWFYHHAVAWLLQPRANIDSPLEDGDVLPVLGGLRVIYTPGHTDGHVSLLLEEQGVLLAGDALQVRRGEFAPPLIFADASDAARSLARLATFDFETLAPSHFSVERDEVRARIAELANTMGANATER
jgi:glyoxylase-like metal-dependent hydrolase (beta-lactamase superfamily II)